MNEAGWIVIRTDGSTRSGIGHVMRCLTLADALARRGLACVFICRRLEGSLPDWLRRAGHAYIELAPEAPAPLPAQGLYGEWLGTTQAHDAEQTLGAIENMTRTRGAPLLVLVDHYGLDREWEKRLRAGTGVPVAAIDDLDRVHDCDFLVDTTYGKDAERYAGKVPARCVVMTGASFALLRPGFAERREEVLAKRDASFAAKEPVRQLLISMGGADSANTTAWILDAVRPLAEDYGIKIHVLVGAAYPYHEQLLATAAKSAGQVAIHRDLDDVPALLAGMDLCIGAAGSSTWERCCLGLPTVNVVLADNQREIGRVLSLAGAVLDAGSLGADAPETPNAWGHNHVVPLLLDSTKRKELSLSSREVTDGRGTMRVVSQLFSARVRSAQVKLRPADEADIALAYEWQCFPETRRFAVNPRIPVWEAHKAWMTRKLGERTSAFYIASAGGLPAGIVRLEPGATRQLPPDVQEHAGAAAKEVSILTAPEFYGHGVALNALRALQHRHGQDTIVAHVLPGNAASRALFIKAGFVPYNQDYLVWADRRLQSTEQVRA